MTLEQYYAECIDMLERQPGDYHVGACQREIIAICHKNNRPITSAVCYIMQGYLPNNKFVRGCNNS